MHTLIRTVAGAGIALAALAAVPAVAATLPEVHINADGQFSGKNLTVLQKSGTALFCRATWGNAFLRLTVIAEPDLVPALVLRNHGGTTTVDEIQEGDRISVEGVLTPVADSLQINATRIIDYTLNKEQKSLAGFIKSVGADGSFILPNKTFGNTTVLVGTSTITKGARTLTVAEIAPKDKVLSAKGSYDYATNILAATSIEIYQDKAVFLPRAFSGTISAISGTALPATVTLSTAGTNYTVYLPATTQVMNKSRHTTEFSRFAVGDKVAVYGAIRPVNLAEVDATSIRDLNF